jgi:ABC-type arginine/histidine transport system permease subunit
LKQNPQFILIAGGGLAGIVLGWLIARRVRRPVIAGLVVTLLPVGGVVAAIVVILMTAKGQEALAVLAVAYFGFLALTPFLVALWITIAIVRGRRAKPAS